MKLFFDLLIAIALIMTTLPAVILIFHRQKTSSCWEYKHPKISLTIILLLLFGSLVLIYGSFIEPRLLVVNEQTIDLPNIKSPIKIAFFADSQVGPYKKADYMEKTVNKILALKPDLVLIGGDIIDNSEPGIDELPFLKPLEKITKQIPTYAINGNHEHGINCHYLEKPCRYYFPNVTDEVKKGAEAIGIHYLVNDLKLVEIKNEKFYLFGGDEWWAKKLDFSVLEKRAENNIPTLALIHNPAAAWEAGKHQIDLMLSGHTHGGQIRFPFVGPFALVDNVVPKQWYQGLNIVDTMQLFVTSGTGETGVRARLFNPPEIALITIK